MRKGRIIDSHAHLVQYIAGTGAGVGGTSYTGNGLKWGRKGSSAPGQFLWISEFLHPSGS